MTAEEWESSTSLQDLLVRDDSVPSTRELLLFNAAGARRVAPYMPDDSARSLIDLTERRADGLVGDAEWGGTLGAVLDQYLGNEAARDDAGGATFGVLMQIYRDEPKASLELAQSVLQARAYLAYTGGYPADVGLEEWVNRAVVAEATAICHLCRCILGNPYRSVVWKAEWRSSTVVGLARGIHGDRAFDRLPILADALQDAGCDEQAVLNHCRADGLHARGCWVVDRALARS